METDDQVYCRCMEELKSRMVVLQKFINNGITTGSKVADIEFLCLQFRKILELISMASIASHRTEYERIRSSFHKDWNARLIMQDIERINPNFYPIPVRKEEPINKNTDAHFVGLTKGFLTRDEFLKVYEICNGLLHTDNPYGKKSDLEAVSNKFKDWTEKIFMLLDLHCIRFPGDDRVWIVQMRQKPDNRVHLYNAEAQLPSIQTT